MPDTKEIIAIKVNFELNTKDGLRRVIFGLEKTKKGNVISWKINFQLLERSKKTDPFGDPLVKFSVEVDQELKEAAEKAAGSKKLTTAQKAHALGPAADDALAAKAGEIDQADAEVTVKDTLAV